MGGTHRVSSAESKKYIEGHFSLCWAGFSQSTLSLTFVLFLFALSQAFSVRGASAKFDRKAFSVSAVATGPKVGRCKLDLGLKAPPGFECRS